MLQLSCMCSSTLKHLSIYHTSFLRMPLKQLCNQYAAYLAGRGEISTAIEAINTIEKGTRTHTHTYSYTYRIARNIGGELNLADWRFASRPPN